MKNGYWMPLLLCIANLAVADSRVPKTDHPLISPYEGSEMKHKDVKEFDEYDAFLGMDETGKNPTGLSLTGRVTKMRYTMPKGRSVLEVFQNYKNALTAADVLFECNQEKRECAERYAGPTFHKYSDITAISNSKGRYVLAKVQQADATAYVAVAVGMNYTNVHIVEVQDMEQGKVSMDAEALGRGLDTQGYVVVGGIFFDTDKAILKPESAEALEQMSILLKERSDLSVYIVGHTDTQGSFSHNKALSVSRAAAVVQALATDYGISRERMESHGVGPLAPEATNTTDSGRARNRRVVMVAR